MEWQIIYESNINRMPWNVYKKHEDDAILEQSFPTKKQAQQWIEKMKKSKDVQKSKKVEVASEDSFPASDPPAWTKTTAGSTN